MAGNNASIGISQNGIYEPEFADGRYDLIYLLFGMRPRIARIRSKSRYGTIGYRKRRRWIGGSVHFAVSRLSKSLEP
jgi:hypothetical protein